jgi:glycosyltransferase involved in cell wall biosynthesis
MKRAPLCTIILPTIGRPKYFGAALESVVAQTYSNLNILVSDNGADPAVKLEARSNLRVVRRKMRIPAVEHINRCIQEADGDYIFLMSDDDILAPSYIAAGMERIADDASVGVVISKQELIDEAFLGPVADSSLSGSILQGSDFTARWADYGDTGVATVFPMLARRSELMACGSFPDYPTASYCDTMVFFRLCLHRKLCLIDGGYFYRIYPTSSGLAAPWSELLEAQKRFEEDLISLHKKDVLGSELLAAILRSDTRLLVNRWLKLYRFRTGLGNKVVPLIDISARLASLCARFGFAALPKFHGWSKAPHTISKPI